MIRYTLSCSRGHRFETWFRGSSDYEVQRRNGHVSCPTCGSSDVAKTLMTPSLATAEARERSVVVAGEKMAEAMRRVRQHVAENADYVGKDFAVEARRRHESASGNARSENSAEKTAKEQPAPCDPTVSPKIDAEASDQRPIWGEATLEEARSLVEDEVPILPLPILPEERN